MRRAVLSFALLVNLTPCDAQAGATMTRIETRPYYGAVVTIEQGVRVWRALPPHDRIIIVPEGSGKVSVNIDAGRTAHAPAPNHFNNTLNINPDFHDRGVGIPLGYGAKRYNRHHGPHHGRGHHGGAHYGTGAFAIRRH